MRENAKFLRSLLLHKWYVFKAGRLTGVPFWRRVFHDWSKFTPAEFGRYARWHHGPAESKDKREWARAWQHHMHNNPHHPEFWLLAWHGDPIFYARDGIGEHVADGVIFLPVPETYVREMVADWMAAGRTYAGDWVIANWVNEHGRKMHLHDETIALVDKIMLAVGYVQTDNCPWSYAASQRVLDWAKGAG